MILLDLLYKGTIRRLFAISGTTARKPFDPLGIPDDRSQCVHVAEVYDDAKDSCNMVRCLDSADWNSRCGYLCVKHQRELYSQQAFVKRVASNRNYDQEIVEAILATEARALRGAKRNVVRLITQGEQGDKIQYLA